MADQTRWQTDHGTYNAVLNGRRCRIVLYPDGSPLAGKYGCYVDGLYKGIASSVDNARSRCRTLSNPPCSARDRINLRTWQPH